MMDPKEILQVRRQLGIARADLSKISGVSESMIAKIENDRVDPSYSKMKALIDALFRLQKSQVKKASDVMSKNPLSVQSSSSVKNAVDLMRQHAISQLPIFDGDRSVGSISEKILIEWMSETEGPEKLFKRSLSEIMADPFPTVGENTPVEMLYNLMAFCQAILVARREKIVGIVTKVDLLK